MRLSLSVTAPAGQVWGTLNQDHLLSGAVIERAAPGEPPARVRNQIAQNAGSLDIGTLCRVDLRTSGWARSRTWTAGRAKPGSVSRPAGRARGLPMEGKEKRGEEEEGQTSSVAACHEECRRGRFVGRNLRAFLRPLFWSQLASSLAHGNRRASHGPRQSHRRRRWRRRHRRRQN